MSAAEVQEVERVEIDGIYRDDIDKYIHLWMDERNIADMCKVSQNRWYNCCQYVYDNVFKINPVYLKDDNHISNQYDIDKVDKVLDIYIRLCNDFEKVINIVGFTFFTGIHRDTLNGWVNGERLGSTASDICKKIDEMREESLVGLQISGKNNPMCYMPSLNRYCGFNMPGVRDQGTRGRALTAAELPQLTVSNCAVLPHNLHNLKPETGENSTHNSDNSNHAI